RVAVVYIDGNRRIVGLWDAATGKRTPELGNGSVAARRISFSIDGKTLVTTTEEHDVKTRMRLWDTDTGKERGSLAVESHLVQAAPILSPDGTMLVTSVANFGPVLWDIASGKRLLAAPGHNGAISQLAFAANGNTLISTGADETIWTWDTR